MSGWWPTFHDPNLGLSARDRVRLHWRANQLMLRSPLAVLRFTLISLLPVPLLVAAVLGVDHAIVRVASGGPRPALVTLALPAVLALLYVVLQHIAFRAVLRSDYMPFVRQALATLGKPVCMRCGHPSPPAQPDGASAHVPVPCPECGHLNAAGPPVVR